MGNRFLEQGGYFGWLGDVGCDSYGAGSEGFDFLDDSGRMARGPGVVDNKGGTTGGQLESVLATHTTAAASDEGDFTIKAGGGWGGRGGHFGK